MMGSKNVMKEKLEKERRKEEEVEETFQVKDRRRFNEDEESDGEQNGNAGETDNGEAKAEPKRPSIIDEYRLRAEAAETKLQEYIEAHKQFRAEQEQVRVRLNRDVDRKVTSRFASLVEDMLGSLDNLDLALQHVQNTPGADALAEGVLLARNGFVQALTSHGIEPIDPLGAEFDPNEADALSMVAVNDPAKNNTVVQVLQPGYRLGETVIRPARVAVGRFSG